MENPNRIIPLVVEGMRPLKIAEVCNTSIGSVVEEIIQAIETKRIKRSQVLETFNKEWQQYILKFFPIWTKKPSVLTPHRLQEIVKTFSLDDCDLAVEEVELCLLCFKRGFTDGDMYEYVCEIELTLHGKIKVVLTETFGTEESGWWRNGIPESVRVECVERREEDKHFVGDGPYNYATLGNLVAVIQWKQSLFKNRLPLGKDKKTPNMDMVLKDLQRLTKIRNKVMHPIGTTRPTEDDFFFVRELREKFDVTKWR